MSTGEVMTSSSVPSTSGPWGQPPISRLCRSQSPFDGGLVDLARQQDLPGDHEPLDLGGPLVELHDLGVAHQLLDRVVLDEAVAAVYLHGVGGDLHGRVGSEALGV